MKKEQVLCLIYSEPPETRDRHVYAKDYKTTVLDKVGNKITLAEDKRLYPYKLDNKVAVSIETTRRRIKFTIPTEYRWNGADIPKPVWVLVGSQHNPEFRIPSMIHDFMLEFKWDILKTCDKLSVPEFRRLTSLAFRQALKDEGINVVKANIMAGCVQSYQATLNSKEWKE